MHVLVLPGWYPNSIDRLTGDFIQRHMHAIALHTKVTVVVPIKDAATKRNKTITNTADNLSEIWIYYPSVSSVKWIDQVCSFVWYNYLCISTIIQINRKHKIDLLHLYVLQKNLFTGLLLHRFLQLPYVISEQSTLYVDGRFQQLNGWYKKAYRLAFKHAKSVHAVSSFLLKHIITTTHYGGPALVIPNVVDHQLFYLKGKKPNEIMTFVHVSNMTFQKNVEGMLQAFSTIKSKADFVINLVGPTPKEVVDLITSLELTDRVVLFKERTYAEVAQIMQQSDMFVFFTRFETFGCVIIEANACGLPVIVTNLEVTNELIKDNINGWFVDNEDVQGLADKLLQAINNGHQMNNKTIAEQTSSTYNYTDIGIRFITWYHDNLLKK